MGNAFVQKLRGYAPLSASDIAYLEAACQHPRKYPAAYDLVREGDVPGPLFVVMEGWACRYKLLPGGSRQIISFLMPGDFCNTHSDVLTEMDYSVITLTDVVIVQLPRAKVDNLVELRPSLAKGFCWARVVDESVLRATIVSMGRRTSLERVAHLLCELGFRMRNTGNAVGGSLVMPFTQIILADAVGLTAVHVNRVIRKLRANGALELRSGTLIIADIAKLALIAGFDDNYLHRRLRPTQTPLEVTVLQ